MIDLVERLRTAVTYGYMPRRMREVAEEAADAIEAQSARIAELESWKAAEDAHHHMLLSRISALVGELAAAREAATDLYKAGRWEITDRFVPADDQAVMWERLRDAIGLPKGTHTALSEPPRP